MKKDFVYLDRCLVVKNPECKLSLFFRKQIELFRKLCSSTGYNLNIVKELLNKIE